MKKNTIENIKVLLATIEDRSQVVETVTKNAVKMGLKPDEIEPTINEATRLLIHDAHYDTEIEIGKAMNRLDALYKLNVTNDPKTAISAQRELNRMRNLRPKLQATPDPDEIKAEKDKRTRPENVDALYDAIDEHLDPLLPPDLNADYPMRIIEAAKMIKKLQKQKPVAKKKTAKKKAAKKKAAKKPSK